MEKNIDERIRVLIRLCMLRLKRINCQIDYIDTLAFMASVELGVV